MTCLPSLLLKHAEMTVEATCPTSIYKRSKHPTRNGISGRSTWAPTHPKNKKQKRSWARDGQAEVDELGSVRLSQLGTPGYGSYGSYGPVTLHLPLFRDTTTHISEPRSEFDRHSSDSPGAPSIHDHPTTPEVCRAVVHATQHLRAEGGAFR